MEVALGNSSTMVPGNPVTVLGNGLRTQNGVSEVSGTMNATVEAPLLATAPSLTIYGPNDIGECDGADLAVEAMSARALQHEWRCDDCDSREPPLGLPACTIRACSWRGSHFHTFSAQ